jgi:hypothetical protein
MSPGERAFTRATRGYALPSDRTLKACEASNRALLLRRGTASASATAAAGSAAGDGQRKRD